MIFPAFIFSHKGWFITFFGNLQKKTRRMIFIGDIMLIDERASENSNRRFNTTDMIGLLTRQLRENA
jgi:hypothetical protein